MTRLFLLALCTVLVSPAAAFGWTSSSSSPLRSSSFVGGTAITNAKRGRRQSRKSRNYNIMLSASSSDNQSEESNRRRRVRASVHGVSVSDQGFWMMLSVPNTTTNTNATNSLLLAIPITNDPPEDTVQATSAESLTLLQLISNVDMAGPTLPPEFLGQVTVLSCELSQKNKSAQQEALLQLIQDSLPNDKNRGKLLYSECNVWQKSRVRLPRVTLDQVDIVIVNDNTLEWTLTCRLVQFPQLGPILVKPTLELLSMARSDGDNNSQTASSVAFACLACALRYKAPIVLETATTKDDASQTSDSWLWLDSSTSMLQKRFPLYKSTLDLQSQSDRVHTNIERGFEIHKLSGALRIAMERGDQQAVQRIRQRLDQYDSMDDLPTTLDENNNNNENNGLDEMQ